MNANRPYAEALAAYRPLAERPAAASIADPEALLQAHHPDYCATNLRPLGLGPNRGESCHRQLATLLEADARIDEADLAGIPAVRTDVLVIGGGGAGAAAALAALEQGARVLLVTKLRLGDSNTIMAEGGIHAAIHADDSPQRHFEDTLRGGHNRGEPELVADLVGHGPEVLQWLIRQGMQFDQDEMGDLRLRRAGGASADRLAYCRDYTGLEMMRVLRAALRNSDVEIWENAPVVELLSDVEGQRCCGAVVRYTDAKGLRIIKAGAVILATGGAGRIHINDFPTSNHIGATADGLVLAYRLGARLRDLDSFQYHPTGLAHPHHLIGKLITEGIRSAGAYLLDAEGRRFVPELAARDLVSAAILRECAAGRGIQSPTGEPGVWLDTPGLEARERGILAARFPKLMERCRLSGVDPVTTPLLIYPTLHYQNGGVCIDRHGATNVPGLYSAGENSGGVHGRNRIMGNALLEIIHFGQRAGRAAARGVQPQSGHPTLEHIHRWRRARTALKGETTLRAPLLFPAYTNCESTP